MIRWMRRALMIAGLMALTGCQLPQSTWDAHGPAAAGIDAMSWWMTILFLAIILVMWVLFAYAFYRRRGSLDEHEPLDSDGGQIWPAIGGVVIPIIVLTALFVYGLDLLRAFPINGTHSNHAAMVKSMKPDVIIIGHQWWWEMKYINKDHSKEFTTANELHLPVGKNFNIELETADVMHSFWIPALHGKMDMIPGQPNYIRIEASQPGHYEGQCAEFCGEEHARMRLLAVAQTPAAYKAWLANQRKPGAVPTTPDAIAGEQIFLGAPCAFCHTVRGTPAGGSVAPDLTHIASRAEIAANVYPNNNAFLEAWITHAQSLKPFCLMPNLTEFSGQQLRDLVAYLRQLK